MFHAYLLAECVSEYESDAYLLYAFQYLNRVPAYATGSSTNQSPPLAMRRVGLRQYRYQATKGYQDCARRRRPYTASCKFLVDCSYTYVSCSTPNWYSTRLGATCTHNPECALIFEVHPDYERTNGIVRRTRLPLNLPTEVFAGFDVQIGSKGELQIC